MKLSGTILDYYWHFTIENDTLSIGDHLNGFDSNYKSEILEQILKIATENNISNINLGYVLSDHFKKKYKINFFYKEKLVGADGWKDLKTYKIHPDLTFENFICSFNGNDHVGRQLLTSMLGNQGYFNTEFCSKNFSKSNDTIRGHLQNLNLSKFEIKLYEKFFVNNDSFNESAFSFGRINIRQFDKNIHDLENKLTSSFLHIVSETMATSYYPFITEKFLYSIVTRGLFVSYAQPSWHQHIKKYYGFKLYDKIFDYSFDDIQNPVKRLIRLIEMISKFSSLSTDDWRDLYHLEQDTIEHNYNHYFSGNYLKHIAQFEK